jgi:hypothetical protein
MAGKKDKAKSVADSRVWRGTQRRKLGGREDKLQLGLEGGGDNKEVQALPGR